jgi:hypothetical protein
MNPLPTLSENARFSRSTVALLVGVAAFAFVFAAVLGLFHGPFLIDNGDSGPEAASFEFNETTVLVPRNENVSESTGVVIAHHSGKDYPQEAVTIEVNGKQAFDFEQESGMYAPWNDSEAPLSEEPTRILLYGEPTDEENADDPEQHSTIEDGDVIEVVWYEPGGDRMNVLQRYVVGAEG